MAVYWYVLFLRISYLLVERRVKLPPAKSSVPSGIS